jgi:hypothetical protein
MSLSQIETPFVTIEGHIKIVDVDSNEVLMKRRNAINYENMSIAIASLLANVSGSTSTYEVGSMSFGNGGTTIDGTGTITYKETNTGVTSATLYNETYSQVIDGSLSGNLVEVEHTSGNLYSDVVCTCTLDYNVPVGQDATDTTTDLEGDYVFDELGIFTANGDMLTHVIFHPVQKSANRKIQVIYTLRIRTSYSDV